MLAGCSASLLAQPTQRPPDSGTVYQENVRGKPLVAPPVPGKDLLPKAPAPKPALGAPGLKLVVQGFRISGNTIYPENVLLEQVTEFIGKEQTIDGLNDAATKVRAYYRERGYFLVQAYLPQQEIKGGIVEIAVIEARIGKVAVNIKEGTRYSESLVRGIVEAHLAEGEIITETGLETPLLLLNDLPNASVTSEIKPSQTVGAADITVNISDPGPIVSGSVDGDNYGNRYTGQYRYGVTFNLNNPIALGDQLTYRGMKTAGEGDMGFYRLAYVVPVGYWGTRIGASYTTFHYKLGAAFEPSNTHGTGSVASLFALHPILRTRGANVIAQVAYSDMKLDDRVGATNSILDRDITSLRMGMVGDFRDNLWGGGLNSFTVTHVVGDASIHQPNAVLADKATFRTRGQFRKKNYEYRRLQKVNDESNLLLWFRGQMANKNLMSAEKFSLGGPDGVRSYPTGEALGDEGWIFTAEYRYTVPGFKLWDGDVTLLGFWDQGHIQEWDNFHKSVTCATGTQPRCSQNERNLSGFGLGASAGRDADYVLRFSASWRNENDTPQSDTARRIPRMWLQGIKWF
ncbi:MAG: ShlB/FhaC/HecB family hemolysin secretion/activation protein [Burkholderiales bacterium]|nr:ShlB/FhaC/HecB family hemolysin secretion/activation protein [Burkholderiales bacterium]